MKDSRHRHRRHHDQRGELTLLAAAVLIVMGSMLFAASKNTSIEHPIEENPTNEPTQQSQ